MSASEQWQMALDAAQRYECVVARHIFRPWATLLADAARLRHGERVLDLACGTGLVARVAAQRVGPDGRVTGVDLNPGMIAVARSLAAPEGARIEWLEGDALAIPLADASVDAVLCQQGLQFFPDQGLAFREMRRVLKRGGRLAVSVWNTAGIYNSAVGEALKTFVDAQTASRFLASRKSPAREEMERSAIAAGFAEVDVRISRAQVRLPGLDRFTLEHLAATPVAPAIAGLDSETRRKIGASVMKALQRFAHADGVTYPEETYVLTASV